MKKSIVLSISVLLLLSGRLMAARRLEFCQTNQHYQYPTVEFELAIGQTCLVQQAPGLHSSCISETPNIEIRPHESLDGVMYPVLKVKDRGSIPASEGFGVGYGRCTVVNDAGATTANISWGTLLKQ